MSGVTAFKTISGRTPHDFDTALNAALGDGYQPIPGSGPYTMELGGVTCMTLVQGSIILVGATGAAGADGAVKTFYGETSSAANTYTATITGATLAAGNFFAIKFDHAPTGAATLNINSLGAKAILLPNGNAISGAEGVDGQINWMVYDGTSFILAVTPNNA